MAQYESSAIEFVVLGVVDDPLPAIRSDLMGNIKALQEIEGKLSAIVEDWKDMQDVDDLTAGTLVGATTRLACSQEGIEAAEMTPRIVARIADAGEDIADLLSLRSVVANQQRYLREVVEDAIVAVERRSLRPT